MTVISELTRIERWIFTLLSQDGTIAGIVGTRIFSGIIPQSLVGSLSSQAAIVYYPLSTGSDARGPGSTRIWAEPLYLVKAVIAASTFAPLQTLVDRIDTVLHANKGATSDATIQFCVRERPFLQTTVEAPGNTIYRHLGGEFRIAASPLVNP